MKKPRIAEILLDYEIGVGVWSWRFYNNFGHFTKHYWVASVTPNQVCSFVIRQATRVAKATGFSDARVVNVRMIEKNREA